MTRVLILGAYGQIARIATDLFLSETDTELTCFLRHAERLDSLRANRRVRIVEGDVLDADPLKGAMVRQDVVYANLSGNLGEQATVIVRVMKELGLRRRIFISSMGIYDEVPGQSFHAALRPCREAADIIEASDLDYRILRPAWLNDREEIDYGTATSGHFPLVIGIIALAIGFEACLHPGDYTTVQAATAVGVGLTLFLVSTAAALWRAHGCVLWNRLTLCP